MIFFIVISNDFGGGVLKDFRTELNCPRENSLLFSQSYDRKFPFAYAIIITK